MKLYCFLFLALFAFWGASAQYTLINHFSGSMAYGSRTITVTPSGGASTYPDPCIGPPSPHFWAGASVAGQWTYTSSAPVYSIKLESEGLNGGPLGTGEYLQVYINGAPYTLTPADIVSYSFCGSPGAPPCYLYGGKFMGPLYSSFSYSVHNAGMIKIVAPMGCAGFTSFGIYCNGVGNGVAYHISFDTTAPPSCLHASNNGPLCAGDSLKLFATGVVGVPYHWYGPLGFTSTQQNPVIPHVTVGQSGTYFVVQTIGGVNDTAFTTVVVNPGPAVTALATTPVCEGDSISFSVGPVSPGMTFDWAGPSSFASAQQNPKRYANLTATGNYTVIASVGSCIDTEVVNVVVNPKPVVTAAGTTPVCKGGTINLSASPFVIGETFHWAGPTGYSSALQNPVISFATASNTGIYTVTASNSSCSDTSTVAISVFVPEVSASANSPLCVGENLQLQTIASPSGMPCQWTGPGSFVSTLPNPVLSNASVANSGTYMVIGGADGCYDTAYVSVVIVPVPQVTVTSDSMLCEGQALHLSAGPLSSDRTFFWSGPNNFSSMSANATISPVTTAASGHYIILVTENGCKTKDTVNVRVIGLGTEFSSDTAVCSDMPITLLLNSGAPANSSVLWSNGSSQSQIEVTMAGEYWVRVSAAGCIRSDTIIVKGEACLCDAVLPNAFTPNNDDVNDAYGPILKPDCLISNYSFRIYNRWGQQVFYSTDPKAKWDGKLLGVPAEMSVYMYYISYSAGLKSTNYHLKGDVTLVR